MCKVSPPHHGSVEDGFTLLEMLLVVTVLAILLIIGVPAIQNFGMRQRMSAAIHELHSHLVLARNEAIRFNSYVVVCPGDESAGCSDSLDWSQGWIVFSDYNNDRQYQAGEPLHRAEPGLDLMTIHSSPGRKSLRFYPNGSAPGSNGSISFCDLRGPTHARKLVISNVGRVRRDAAENLDAAHCPVATR